MFFFVEYFEHCKNVSLLGHIYFQDRNTVLGKPKLHYRGFRNYTVGDPETTLSGTPKLQI